LGRVAVANQVGFTCKPELVGNYDVNQSHMGLVATQREAEGGNDGDSDLAGGARDEEGGGGASDEVGEGGRGREKRTSLGEVTGIVVATGEADNRDKG